MGRHGGINILHQKSWHVWRMDNRLRVERDELKHAKEEREKKDAERQATFNEKLVQMRRRARGHEMVEKEEMVGLAPAALLEGNEPHGANTTTPSSSSTGTRGGECKQKGTGAATETSYKYGMVTLSNLKQAECFLDLTLKAKGRKSTMVEGYWGSGGLGTGTHINLFEGAELEAKRHLADHQKQIRYTERNNELLEKSKKALFSEFDEIASHVPWYLQPRRQNLASMVEKDGQQQETEDAFGTSSIAMKSIAALACDSTEDRPHSGSRFRSRSRKRIWTERHGQTMIQVKASKRKAELKNEVVDIDGPVGDVIAAGVCDAEGLATRTDEGKRKSRKEVRRRNKKKREKEELELLRRRRDDRERQESARASRFLGAGGACWADVWGRHTLAR